MQQSKLDSLKESVTNVVVGIVISVITQLILYPIYGIHISLFVNVQLTLWFTVISIVRSYLIRRYHNWKLHKNNTVTQQLTA